MIFIFVDKRDNARCRNSTGDRNIAVCTVCCATPKSIARSGIRLFSTNQKAAVANKLLAKKPSGPAFRDTSLKAVRWPVSQSGTALFPGEGRIGGCWIATYCVTTILRDNQLPSHHVLTTRDTTSRDPAQKRFRNRDVRVLCRA